MKITELKNMYQKKGKETAKNFKKSSDELDVTITSVYSISVGKWDKIKASAISVSENNSWRYLQVRISLEGYRFTNSYSRLEKEELDYHREQLKIMAEYWTEYSKLKGYNGFVIFTQNESRKDLHQLFKEVFAQSIDNKYIELQEIVLKRNSVYFLGGAFSEEYFAYMDAFFQSKLILEEVMSKNPLISFPKGYTIWNLFSATLYLLYCGEEIRFEPNLDYTSVSLHFHNSKTFEDKTDDLPLESKKITAYLEEIKEMLGLATLLNPPMDNFARVIEKLFYDCEKDDVKSLFEGLQNKLGSWEEVESECKEILDKYTGRMKEFLITEMKDKKDREMEIYKFQTDKRNYHFISIQKREGTKWRKYFVIPSTEEYPPEVKSMVIEYFLPDYQ